MVKIDHIFVEPSDKRPTDSFGPIVSFADENMTRIIGAWSLYDTQAMR